MIGQISARSSFEPAPNQLVQWNLALTDNFATKYYNLAPKLWL